MESISIYLVGLKLKQEYMIYKNTWNTSIIQASKLTYSVGTTNALAYFEDPPIDAASILILDIRKIFKFCIYITQSTKL